MPDSTVTAETFIRIDASMDNAVSYLGGVLSQMGMNISWLTGSALELGKESAAVFRDYELSMKDAEAALSTQHKNGAELAAIMDDLDVQARQWAATTIFHTGDIAGAVALAAHAGYSYQDIKSRMPAAMRLAQAGNISLSDALNYLIKSSYALGISADSADDFVDMWVYAANNSATTVEEIGKAMLVFGPTMRWADGPEEILTMIATLANVGTTGQEAAQLLTSPIIRIIMNRTDRSKRAVETLQLTEEERYSLLIPMLSEYGVSEQQFQEEYLGHLRSWEKDVEFEVVQYYFQQDTLDGFFRYLDRSEDGFSLWTSFLRSIYKEYPDIRDVIYAIENENFSRFQGGEVSDLTGEIVGGRLRPLLAIYTDMHDALIRITGTGDYLKNERAAKLIGAIFPVRSIQGATALLNGAASEWDGLYEAMISGRSTGYAQYVADTMMDTLYGSMEILGSRIENLKLTVGEIVAEDAAPVMTAFGELFNAISVMDPATLDTLIRIAEVLAASSTVLLLTGGAMRLAGLLANPMGLIGISLMTAATVGAAINELNEAEYADEFGSMKLDKGTLNTFVRGIGLDFEKAYENVGRFRQALDGAVNSFTTASGSLASSLFTAMATGKTLTEGEINTMKRLGEEMFKALMDSLSYSASGSMTFWEALFGGEAEAADNPAYQEIITATNDAYQRALDEATAIGQRFREKLGAALSNDGQISPEEYQELLDEMRAYNMAMAYASAEAQKEEDYANMASILHKAQTAGYDDLVTLTEQAETERKKALSHAQERFWSEYYRLQYYGISTETQEAALARFEQEQAAMNRQYDQYITRMWLSQFEQSDQAAGYRFLRDITRRWMQGLITDEEAERALSIDLGKSAWVDGTSLDQNTARSQLGRMMGTWLFYMGGPEEVARQISYAEATGDSEWAATLREAFAMAGLVNRFSMSAVTEGWFGTGFMAGYISDGAGIWEDATRAALGLPAEDVSLNELRLMIGRGEVYNYLSTVYERWQNGGTLLPPTGAGPYTTEQQTLLNNWANISTVVEMLAESYDLEKVVSDLQMDSGSAEINKLLGVWALLYGGQGVRDRLKPETYRRTPGTGNGAPAEPKQSGANSLETFSARISQAIPTAVVSFELIRGNLLPLAAEGGRADGPAIFGEAGPEWAIPEEHSGRAAALLNAARAASGFTWADLLARYGGQEARRLIYRPFFDVADAAELRQALREDKARLAQWLDQPEGVAYA